MPATKLGRKYVFNPTVHMKQMERLILIGMARKGIRTQTELGHRIGMSQSAISKRMSGDVCWSFLEICRLVRELDLTAEELYSVIGGPAA